MTDKSAVVSGCEVDANGSQLKNRAENYPQNLIK